jgi:hypothetical protein
MEQKTRFPLGPLWTATIGVGIAIVGYIMFKIQYFPTAGALIHLTGWIIVMLGVIFEKTPAPQGPPPPREDLQKVGAVVLIIGGGLIILSGLPDIFSDHQHLAPFGGGAFAISIAISELKNAKSKV